MYSSIRDDDVTSNVLDSSIKQALHEQKMVSYNIKNKINRAKSSRRIGADIYHPYRPCSSPFSVSLRCL